MQNKPIFSAVQQMAEHIETCLVDRGTRETRIGTLVINTALVVSKIMRRQYRRVYLKRFAVWNIPPDVMRNVDVDTIVGLIKICFRLSQSGYQNTNANTVASRVSNICFVCPSSVLVWD